MIENAGEGNDTAKSYVMDYRLTANVESLEGTAFNERLFGDAGANKIAARTAPTSFRAVQATTS